MSRWPPLAIPAMAPVFVWPAGLEWWLLLGVGVATQVGQVSLTRGLALLRAGPGKALSYLQALFAACWGFLVFGERPVRWTWLGGGAILASAIWIAWNPSPADGPAPTSSCSSVSRRPARSDPD